MSVSVVLRVAPTFGEDPKEKLEDGFVEGLRWRMRLSPVPLFPK